MLTGAGGQSTPGLGDEICGPPIGDLAAQDGEC
jgi:hypothetical protein